VVKNSCGYRIEAVLDNLGQRISPVAALLILSLKHHPASPSAETVRRREGTLGLITEATLNLVPLPAKRGIAMAYFASVFAAGEAVSGILA
jgi:FAD/FMN-containing dehydrogenase